MFHRTHTLKSTRLKERRRKIIVGKAVLSFLSVLGLLWLVFWLAGLPAITILTIEVSGTVSVSSSNVASSTEKFLAGYYCFTIPRVNFFFYPKKSRTKNENVSA